MSASFHVTPKDRRIAINADGPSRTLTALKSVFGDPPFNLSHGDLPVLAGMKAVNPENPAWGELIDAVEKYDSVTLEVTY